MPLLPTRQAVRVRIAPLLALAMSAPFLTPIDDAPPPITTNDNRTAAGTLVDGVWRVDLEAALGTWHPEADEGIGLEVLALREVGGPLLIPSPLIRVPVGTDVEVSVSNPLDIPLSITGLVDLPADTVVATDIAPGTTERFRFRAGGAGTYWYRAHLATDDRRRRVGRGSQMQGAIVVDDGPTPSDDRIFVIGIWRDPRDTSVTPVRDGRETLVINGKSWPHTERIVHTIGDSIRWRWINATGRAHPMHLHGYFYDVLSRGSQTSDSIYSMADHRSVVTETLLGGQTMSVAWQPPFHPGNWLFHCHLSFHVRPELVLTEPEEPGDHTPHMAGLVLGIHVKPRDASDVPDRTRMPARTVRLTIDETGVENGQYPPLTLTMKTADATHDDTRSGGGPGPALIFRQGEAADVRVVNNLDEPASIHWHGLELDSYSDGVPDWSGLDTLVMHPIAPGDSFTAQLTLLRPGTFLYHSHINDIPQLLRGLYGAILVLPPEETYDPRSDHVFIGSFGTDREERFFGIVNGDTLLPDLELVPGRPHRLRFAMIAPGGNFYARLVRADSSLAQWRPIAKDGGDLPAHQAVMGPAELRLFVGETADVEVVPDTSEPLWLEVEFRNQPVRRAKLIVR